MCKERIAEYLEALDPQACLSYCNQVGIDYIEVIPYEFTEGVQVFECLKLFLDNRIPLSVLLGNGDVWGMYLKSIVEERYHTAIDLLTSVGFPADIVLYFNACYRFGFPAMDDKSFDVLEQLYIQTFPQCSFLTERTYDDDEYGQLVLEAIKLSGVRTANSAKTTVNSANIQDNPGYADLNEEKSTSIRPVVDIQEAFDFVRNSPICPVHFSLKIDGVNTKVALSHDNSGLELALSRGRSTDSIDYTAAIRMVLQKQGVNDKMLTGRVTGESFVPLDKLAIIQSRYPGKEYKTPKSTAMAMLRAPDNFTEEDYSYLSFFAFDHEGRRADIAFSELRSAGFQTPPELQFSGEEVPRNDITEFSEWLFKEVLLPMQEAGDRLGIGSDGVVFQLLADIHTERRDKYSDANIAIKFGPWAAASYTATVEEILVEQRRVEASIVLRIAPTVMRDKNTATRVGVGSPDILIRDDVRVGDTIEFERKSEAYNVYLRKLSSSDVSR